MNYTRTLGVTNVLLMLIGYQVHRFDSKTRKYHLSLWTIGHFIMISVLYLISFSHHFEKSPLMNLIQVVSPFLNRLISIQLFIGIKVYFYSIYEQRMVIRASNEFGLVLPKVHTKMFSREEAYAYFLNFSTLLIGLCITIYVAYEMEFTIPPVDNILIFCALFIPHFMLGGAMKLYNIGIWLQRERIIEFQWEFERICDIHQMKNKTIMELENGPVDNQNIKKLDLIAILQPLQTQLNQLAQSAKLLNATLQRQLALLLLLNGCSLLTGTYTRVYYENSWKLMFIESTRNVFQATNFAIFILIFWDYFTLFLTQMFFGNVKKTFLKTLNQALIQHHRYTESTLIAIKDMHKSLKNVWSCKVLSMAYMNSLNLIVLHLFFGLTIALIVVYQYLRDQMVDLSNRIDSVIADDE